MTKFTHYDSADYLETEEDIAAYLDAVVLENKDDSALIMRALSTVARARNLSQLARDAGITREGLYKALSENGNPSFATVAKIVNALGLHIHFASAKQSSATKTR